MIEKWKENNAGLKVSLMTIWKVWQLPFILTPLNKIQLIVFRRNLISKYSVEFNQTVNSAYN